MSLILSSYADEKVFFREDFNSLEKWRPFHFLKKKGHTLYTIERQGDRHYLRAESHASASALVYKERFNVYEYPRVRWRWKVNNVYVRADAKTKAGDDYPMRIYIMFEADREKEGFFERLRNGILKKLYGEYPPQSSLDYVWASKEYPETIITSPNTGKIKNIFLEMGNSNVGKWKDEDINIIDDYRKAFGKDPPSVAGIAVMNDSDDTGESSVSFLEYIEVYR